MTGPLDAYPAWQRELILKDLPGYAPAVPAATMSAADWERGRLLQRSHLRKIEERIAAAAARRAPRWRRAQALRTLAVAERQHYGPPPVPQTPMVRIIGRIGAIGDTKRPMVLATDVERTLAQYPRPKEIALFIESEGGLEDEAQEIVSMLRATHARISARVGALCASAAVRILLASDWREARADSVFLIHGSESALATGRQSAEWHRRRAAFIEAHDKRMIAMIAARTGARREAVALLVKEGKRLTAREALHLGLVHQINEIAA